MSKMEPQLIDGFQKLIKEENASKQPQPVDSKKRKINEISGNNNQNMNSIQKIRRITQDEDYQQIASIKRLVPKKKRMDELPWDLLGLIMNYTPKNQVYPILRGVSK